MKTRRGRVRIAGYEVLRVAEEIVTDAVPVRLAGAVQPVDVPLKSKADRAEFAKFLKVPEHFAARVMRADVLASETQALAIGDLTIVALPGEPFVETGMAIKARLAGREVVVLGYSNDDVRYILPASAYQADKYETLGTWLSPDAEQALIDAGVAAVEALQS